MQTSAMHQRVPRILKNSPINFQKINELPSNVASSNSCIFFVPCYEFGARMHIPSFCSYGQLASLGYSEKLYLAFFTLTVLLIAVNAISGKMQQFYTARQIFRPPENRTTPVASDQEQKSYCLKSFRSKIVIVDSSDSSFPVKRFVLNKVYESLSELFAAIDPNHEIKVELYNNMHQKFMPLDDIKQIYTRHERILHLTVFRLTRPSSFVPLAVSWREFDIGSFAHGDFQINNESLFVNTPDNSTIGTGQTIWDGSIVLAKYLEHHAAKSIANKHILEIGAGAGLVGLAAGKLGAKSVLMTDLKYTMDNLKLNIIKNNLTSTVTAVELDWTSGILLDNCSFFDTIVAADVVWLDELIEPLIAMLENICKLGKKGSISIIFAYQSRSRYTDMILFTALKNHQFNHLKISKQEYHPLFQSERIALYQLEYIVSDE